MRQIKIGCACFSLMLVCGCAFSDIVDTNLQGPWLTGPLLAAAEITQPAGEVNVEPYFYFTKTYTSPNIFTVSPSLSLTQGLAKNLDLQTYIPYAFNEAENQWYTNFQDIILILGIQAISTDNNSWLPNLRVVLQETFPSGKFQNLSPNRFSTDLTGEGSYQTALGTNFGQIFQLPNGKFLHALLTLLYTVPANVNVNGLDAYGGGMGTKGVVHPGNNFSADFALEYTLSQHWAVAMDATYSYTDVSTFSGNSGIDADGSVAMVGAPSNELVTLAPALEYNFSSSWGIIAGVWFTVYAHNGNNFTSGVIAINYNS